MFHVEHSRPPHAGFFTPENTMKPRITDIRHHQLAETQREARAKTRIFEPLESSDFAPVLRPGALDHEKYGNRQPDGSVKPFARIGYLSSSVRVNFAYKEK